MTNVTSSRRQFLRDLGTGALAVSGAGYVGAMSPAGSSLWLGTNGERLDFGKLEPLAAWMQDSDADQVVTGAIKKLRAGTTLQTLVAAGALANTRTFGGTDYIGYHCAMALMPAFEMSRQMPKGEEALPVLKVLHRNTTRIRQQGGRKREALREVHGKPVAGKSMLQLERLKDMEGAERAFKQQMRAGTKHAFETLQPLMRDNIDVHQIVLTWRAKDLLQLTGAEHAHAMLRQCVRHYVDRERARINKGRSAPSLRSLLPKLMQEHGLEGKAPGKRAIDVAYIDKLAGTIMRSSRDDAAAATAEALADGVSIDVIGEAISRASVRLLLGDPGRASGVEGKPKGSVHGASVGVHACDSAQAWRNISHTVSAEQAVPTLIAAAWHTGGQSYASSDSYAHAKNEDEVAGLTKGDLPHELRASIRQNDNRRAAAIGERWLAAGLPAADAFSLLIDFMAAGDGALHHEKFFRTTFEGVAQSHESFHPQWLACLARVAASGYGFAAPGYAQASELLRG